MKALKISLLVLALVCVVVGVSLDCFGPDNQEASRMVAAADQYRAEGPRGRSAARLLYREAAKRYPGTLAAWEAKIKNAIFYRFNPWDRQAPLTRPTSGPLVVVPVPGASPEGAQPVDASAFRQTSS